MKPRCAITNLPIYYKDKIVVILLESNNEKYEEFGQPYVFASLPIFCTYDDYHYIYDVQRNDNVELLEQFYNKSIANIVEDRNELKLYILQSAYDAMLVKHCELYSDYFNFENYEFSRKWARLLEWNSRKWESFTIGN